MCSFSKYSMTRKRLSRVLRWSWSLLQYDSLMVKLERTKTGIGLISW